ASGVKILDEVLQAFNEVKTRHNEPLPAARLMNTTARDWRSEEGAGRGVYGVYDIEYELESKQKRNKLVFVSCGPGQPAHPAADAHRLLQERPASQAAGSSQGDAAPASLGEITEDCHDRGVQAGRPGLN
uniref:MT domain-containing protein n=1 Tax=Macrostomum lignano TaxID=282301 RepID=A0A1I8FPX6_9PLAT